MKSFFIYLYIDYLIIRNRLLVSQYGDLTYGHDVRKKERKDGVFRKKLIAISRAPVHAGFDWDRE